VKWHGLERKVVKNCHHVICLEHVPIKIHLGEENVLQMLGKTEGIKNNYLMINPRARNFWNT
jgi:hypothetical protein